MDRDKVGTGRCRDHRTERKTEPDPTFGDLTGKSTVKRVRLLCRFNLLPSLLISF